MDISRCALARRCRQEVAGALGELSLRIPYLRARVDAVLDHGAGLELIDADHGPKIQNRSIQQG